MGRCGRQKRKHEAQSKERKQREQERQMYKCVNGGKKMSDNKENWNRDK